MAKIKATSGMIFERYEKKYRITEESFEMLYPRLLERMNTDKYGLYTVCSLYLDTDDYLLIRRSMEKPAYKEKLRMRSYGIPHDDTKVFIELKKKLHGITYKRRITVPYSEAKDYFKDRRPPSTDGQILREIDYFMDLYRPSPKVLLFYDRLALFGKEDKELRITFDKNIRYRTDNTDPSFGASGTALILPNERIMEIKVPGTFPVWLSKLLSELKIYPSSFSKYAAAYRHLRSEAKLNAEQHHIYV